MPEEPRKKTPSPSPAGKSRRVQPPAKSSGVTEAHGSSREERSVESDRAGHLLRFFSLAVHLTIAYDHRCYGWRARSAGVCLSLAHLLSGCGADDEDGLGCDIRRASCQRDVFDGTASMRGQDGSEPPRVRTKSLDEVEAELRENDEVAGPVDLAWDRALSLMGLASPSVDVRGALRRDFLDGVAAFYDTITKEVTIIDRGISGDRISNVLVLSHEFVHALQDEELDLEDYRERWVHSTDNEMAVRTVIEGEAVVVSTMYGASVFGGTRRGFTWERFGEDLIQSGLDFAEESEIPFLGALLAVPYGVGTRALGPVWRNDGAAAVRGRFVEPEVVFAKWAVDAERVPLHCVPAEGPSGYHAVDHDSFGMLGSYGLRVRLADSDAWANAGSWRDDRVVLFAPDGEEIGSENVAVAWRLRDHGLVSVAADVARLDGLSRVVTTVADEVIIAAAADPDVLGSWNGTACGAMEDLPPEDGDEPAVASVWSSPWRGQGWRSERTQRHVGTAPAH